MAWFAGQSLLALILTFLLGLLVGWLIWARRQESTRGTDTTDDRLQLELGRSLAEPARADVAPTSHGETRPEPVVAATSAAPTAPTAPTDLAAPNVPATPTSPAAPAPAPAAKRVPAARPAPQRTPAATPAAGPEANPAVADHIERIEGIGPKIAAALRTADLGSFAAIADAHEDDLRAAIKTAGLRSAPSLPTWSRQARLLADGDEAGLGLLTQRLVAGREV